MMRKSKLIILSISPILIGCILNYLVLLMPFLIYLAPFLMIAYWFWVGKEFAKIIKNPIIAILLANSIGIISLLLYYWQFVILQASERNLFISGFSQMFTTPLDYISALMNFIFKAHNEATYVTTLAMQTLELILMLIVFSSGYFYMKHLSKQHNN